MKHLLLLLLLAGCTSQLETIPLDIEFGPIGWERDHLMKQGQTLHWDWSADRVVRFDIHTHFEHNVTYELDITSNSHKGSYKAPEDGFYSMFFRDPAMVGGNVTGSYWFTP